MKAAELNRDWDVLFSQLQAARRLLRDNDDDEGAYQELLKAIASAEALQAVLGAVMRHVGSLAAVWRTRRRRAYDLQSVSDDLDALVRLVAEPVGENRGERSADPTEDHRVRLAQVAWLRALADHLEQRFTEGPKSDTQTWVGVIFDKVGIGALRAGADALATPAVEKPGTCETCACVERSSLNRLVCNNPNAPAVFGVYVETDFGCRRWAKS